MPLYNPAARSGEVVAACAGGGADDTAAIEAAITTAKALGGTVIINQPIVLCNIAITGVGVRIKHRCPDFFTGTPVAYIGPYDPDDPAITIGDGTTLTHSIFLEDIGLIADSGDKKGLYINGAYQVHAKNFSARRFETASLSITSSASRPSFWNHFNNFFIEPGNIAGAFGVLMDYGASYVTGQYFANGAMRSTGSSHDHLMQITGACTGGMSQVYFEGADLQGIEFAGAAGSLDCANVLLDSSANTHILVELAANEPVSNRLRGQVKIDGCVKTPAATSAAMTDMWHMPYQTVFDTPHMIGPRFYAAATSPASRYTTTDPTVAILRTGSNIQIQGNNAHFYQTDGSTNAPILVRYVRTVDGITAPTATAGEAHLYVDTSDGDLKVRFGDNFTAAVQADS